MVSAFDVRNNGSGSVSAAVQGNKAPEKRDESLAQRTGAVVQASLSAQQATETPADKIMRKDREANRINVEAITCCNPKQRALTLVNAARDLWKGMPLETYVKPYN